MSFQRPLRSFSNLKDSVSSAGSFNSSLNSSTSSFSKLGSIINADDDFKENKKCHICEKKFTFTFRRHHCRMCKESVCDEHSVIRFVREGKTKKLRVCDKCDRKHIKELLQEDILNEINNLQQQIRTAVELNANLYKEKFERTSRIHNLEMKLNQSEKEMKKAEEEMENRLKEEMELNVKAKGRIDDFMCRLKDMQESEAEINEKLSNENLKLIKLKAEKEGLERRKTELDKQKADLDSKLKDTYQIDVLMKTCCEDCKRKLSILQKPRMSALSPSKK